MFFICEVIAMAELPIAAKLLRASQLAYDVTTNGPVAIRPPFDEIGLTAQTAGFAVGNRQIDAALVGETASEVIVAFRGTLPLTSASTDKKQVLLDWLGDLDARPVAGQNLPGLVHEGFLSALDALWPAVSAAVPAGKPLHFTGHSKGGALADLAAARYATQHPAAPAPMVTTFAAAKPGDGAFHAAYDQLVPHSVRYEYSDDLVPHLPPSLQFRAMFLGFDLFAAEIARAAALLPVGVAGYEGVGELLYIEASGAVVPDSDTLRLERYLSLAQLLINPGEIVSDHSLSDDGGYARAVLPQTLQPEISQRVPGVSRVM
jgi:hypothetical protein